MEYSILKIKEDIFVNGPNISPLLILRSKSRRLEQPMHQQSISVSDRDTQRLKPNSPNIQKHRPKL